MDDDLEYFIAFPTPKPYIQSLNKKFNHKYKKKQYMPDPPPPLDDCSLKKTKGSIDHTSINLSSIPSATTLTTTSNCSDSNKDSLDQSSLSSMNTSATSETSCQHVHDPDNISISVQPEIIDDKSAGSSDESEEDEEDLLSPNDSTLPYFSSSSSGSGEREPLVLLLGWLGAQDKHLAKYSALYTARGCICMRYTAPPTRQFYRHPGSYMAPLAQSLVQVLREMNLNNHPIICHAFSNHGATLYHFVSRALKEDSERAARDNEEPMMLRGCIFDSCPAPRRVWSGVCAVYNVVRGPAWVRGLAACGVWLWLLGWALVGVLSSLVTGRQPKRLPWALVQEPRTVPQLFLYSSADSLIRASDIETFVSERKKRGVECHTHRWQHSPHVQHFRLYPGEYSRLVFRFLCHCLEPASTSSVACDRRPLPPSTLQLPSPHHGQLGTPIMAETEDSLNADRGLPHLPSPHKGALMSAASSKMVAEPQRY